MARYMNIVAICACLLPVYIASATPEHGEAEGVGLWRIDHPRWQRNGDWIAFTRTTDDTLATNVYKIQANGSGLTQLTTSGKADTPQWNITGTILGYHSTAFSEYKTIGNDGAQGSLGIHNGSSDWLGWSPDGIYTAGLVQRDSPQFVLLMTVQGTERKSVGTGLEGDWHPAGRYIIVSRSSSDKHRHLWEIDTQSNVSRQVTFGNYDDDSPRYSPQGDMIVFNSVERGEALDTGSPFFIVLRDGSSMASVPLGDSSDYEYSGADFSPNGQYLVFGRGLWEACDLYTCRLDGTNLNKMTSFYSISGPANVKNKVASGKWWLTGKAVNASTRRAAIQARNVLTPDKKGVCRPITKTRKSL